MPQLALIREKVELLGFDIYDTVLPFRPKFLPAFEAYLDDRTYDAEPERLFETWQAKLFYYMNVNNAVGDPRPPIMMIGHRALKAVLAEHGYEYTPTEVQAMLHPWVQLEPHPDVIENFERLGETYVLVGLSNGDPDMLEAVRPSLNGTLDGMVSSAHAGTFKPAPEPYHLLLERYDLAAHQVMYVAAHDFDIIGPHRVGMYACFLERVNPYGEWPTQPDLHVNSMHELADLLLSEPNGI